jgi:glycosyltransferase involved in cell wall biosynthesis
LRDTYPASDLIQWCDEPLQGLSRARNRAVGMARGEFLAFIDDDATARPNWLTSILDAFNAFGACAKAVGGRVEPIWTVPRPDWLHDELLAYLSLLDWGGARRSVQRKEWIVGTNMAFRTEALRATGGFLETLGRKGASILLSNEEQDVLDKIRASGGLVVYAPEACVDHIIPRARLTQSWFRKRAAWQAISDYMVRGDKIDRDIATHWNRLASYQDAVGERDMLAALHGNTDDAAAFRDQLKAIYDSTILSISGFKYSDDANLTRRLPQTPTLSQSIFGGFGISRRIRSRRK